MNLKPWREVITPHEDVLHGTFQESEFAADLTKVVRGVASPEYQDAALFFQRTVITEGMGRLLESVVKRLAGQGGDPVMQLQTAFGGGKTHTMLAVYHVASGRTPARDLMGVPALLDHTGVSALPSGRVAVLDGNNLAPAQPRSEGTLQIHTLWGEMAFQLGGAEGYEMVRASDEQGTSPGKDVLVRLFERFAPCVVLIDEAVAYLRQFQPGKSYPGGTFDSNLSFVQALTEAATAVPNVMVLGSLPESIMEVGDQHGQRALDALEKYFGRVEAVWKPVAPQEAFEIVRRRLFKPVQDDAARDAVIRAFADYYLTNSQEFPAETGESTYQDRLRESYPIHPEVFLRLYEDWSTLPKFQRTRGVLRLMARLIYRLWSDGNQDLLIMPGSFPLADREVRTELIKYLDAAGWDAIVERDVDGRQSVPNDLDDQTPALGQLQACRRATRTIFLGSAPSSSAQRIRGIGIERIRLGCAQPPQSPGRYTDAVRRLSDKLHYLYSGNDRYWYDTRPNLRREMEDRTRRFDRPATYYPEIQKRLERLLGRSGLFGGAHVFRDDADIPDDTSLRLIALTPDYAHRRGEKESMAIQHAGHVAQHRGHQPRLNQHRLVFLAADAEAYAQLRLHTRAYLAWDSIVQDREQLNLDPYHQRQAEASRQQAEDRMNEALLHTYCWLLAPFQELNSRGELQPVMWEEGHIERTGQRFIENLERTATELEMVVPRWSPVHLKNILTRFYFNGGTSDVSTKRLWEDFGRFSYLPRLKNREVLVATIEDGIQQTEYFGLATGKDGDRYTGLVFGKPGRAYLDDGELLIAVDKADQPPKVVYPTGSPAVASDSAAQPAVVPTPSNGDATEEIAPALKTRFYGAIELDPVLAKSKFSDVVDEVIQHFSARYGTSVQIRVEIQASDARGFDGKLQSTVRENSNTLGFGSAEFEED